MNKENLYTPKPLIRIIAPSFSKTYNNVIFQGGQFIQKSEVSRLDRVLGVNTKTEETVEIIKLYDPPDFASSSSNLPPVAFRGEGGAVSGCGRDIDSLETEEEEAARDGILSINPAAEVIPLCGEIKVGDKATRMFAKIKVGSEEIITLIDRGVISIIFEGGFG